MHPYALDSVSSETKINEYIALHLFRTAGDIGEMSPVWRVSLGILTLNLETTVVD